MDYRTVLLHADPSSHAAARARYAAALAKRLGAHLVGAATTGISRYVCPQGYSGGPGDIIAGYLDPVYASAQRCLDECEAAVRGVGTPSWERRVVSDQPDDGLARQAAFADLVVLSQNDPAESTSLVVSNLPEYVVLNGAKPVLIVPVAEPAAQGTERVLLAWNGSKEAIAAMTGALPLLRRAQQVWVAMLDPSREECAAAQADLAAYLARHGVQAGMLVRPRGDDDGITLLSLAAEFQCDLLVMGCYGRTRFRELLLGGASRTVLRSMTLPVLMAH